MPIFYNDLPLNKALLLNQMSDPTVGNTAPQEPEPVPWSPTDHPVFMPPEDMYMLTGDYPNYDPAGNPLKKDGTDTFTSRNAQLVEKLQAMSQSNPKVQFEHCKGRYDNKDEQSVLLKGLPLNEVIKLAKEHGQASIVHLPPYPAANRMVYVNGPHANEHEHGIRENTKTFASPPSDAYSFIPSLGKYLRLDFNWGNYHPNESQDSCPEDTGGPQEPAMKSEKTITDATKAIANLLKKHIKEHEDFLVELRKADKCGKCGKSPCACKGVKKCSKCGDMMKMDKCSKCDMSNVSKSERDIVEVAQFLAVASALVKAEGEKKGAKRLQDEPQSLTDGGEGPKKVPESKELSAPGSGNDPKAGKVEKAASIKKSVQDIKAEPSATHGAPKAAPKAPAAPAGGAAAGPSSKNIPSSKAKPAGAAGKPSIPPTHTGAPKMKMAEDKMAKFESDLDLMVELVKSFDLGEGEDLAKSGLSYNKIQAAKQKIKTYIAAAGAAGLGFSAGHSLSGANHHTPHRLEPQPERPHNQVHLREADNMAARHPFNAPPEQVQSGTAQNADAHDARAKAFLSSLKEHQYGNMYSYPPNAVSSGNWGNKK